MNVLLNKMPYTSDCIYSRINSWHMYAREYTLFELWPVPTLLNLIMLGITNEVTLAK